MNRKDFITLLLIALAKPICFYGRVRYEGPTDKPAASKLGTLFIDANDQSYLFCEDGWRMVRVEVLENGIIYTLSEVVEDPRKVA